MSISTCSFSMMPLNDQAQVLTINFENGDHKSVGSNQFIFKKKSEEPFKKNLHDICSQNGYCSDAILSSLFKDRDVKSTHKILAEVKKHTTNAHKIFVLDIKGEKQKYLDPSIPACEEVVLNFFKNSNTSAGSKHAGKMHALFKQPNLDYIFNEGSLKSVVLQQAGFADSQVEYLQQNKKGIQDFCNIAEFILNGFKLGYETDNFKANDYIVPLSNDPFKPHQVSTVFYPPSYEELYSPDTPFFKTLSSCFSIQGELNSVSKVSTIKVKNLSL